MCSNDLYCFAGVAELADAADSKWVLPLFALPRTETHESERPSVYAGSVNAHLCIVAHESAPIHNHN